MSYSEGAVAGVMPDANLRSMVSDLTRFDVEPWYYLGEYHADEIRFIRGVKLRMKNPTEESLNTD